MSTLERASHHEAGHAVIQWILGGSIGWIAIQHHDGEWQGMCGDIPALPSVDQQAVKLMLGGLAEARFAARQETDAPWLVAEDGTVESLKDACRPSFSKNVSIHFETPTGEQRDPITEPLDDLFSDDTVQVFRLAQQEGLNIDEAVLSSIKTVNDPTIWRCIEHVAGRLAELRDVRDQQLEELCQQVLDLHSGNNHGDTSEE